MPVLTKVEKWETEDKVAYEGLEEAARAQLMEWFGKLGMNEGNAEALSNSLIENREKYLEVLEVFGSQRSNALPEETE